jgi:hypothetical protein
VLNHLKQYGRSGLGRDEVAATYSNNNRRFKFIHFIKRHLVARKLEYLLREIVFCEQCSKEINEPLQELCRKTLDDIKTDVDYIDWRSKIDEDGWDNYFNEGHEQRDEW